jgi:hypothetical protein
MATWPLTWYDMEHLPNTLWSDKEQVPDMEQLPKHTFLNGTFVSHVNDWVLWSNGNVQYKYLFPKTARALLN